MALFNLILLNLLTLLISNVRGDLLLTDMAAKEPYERDPTTQDPALVQCEIPSTSPKCQWMRETSFPANL